MPTMRVRQPQPPRAPSAPRPPTPKQPPGSAPMMQQAGGQPTGVNQNPNSKQYGQTYVVQPTTGGVFHVYPNGQKIFVRAGGAPAPAPASASAASAASAAPVDPRDSTYYAQSAQDLFGRNQKLSQLTTEGTQDTTDHQEALRRMLENQPKAIQNARETANKQGLFYSGKLGEREGDINTQYARQQGDMTQAFERRQAAREAARTALEQGASIDDAANLAAAADRAIGRDTSAAAAGALVAPEPDPAPEAPPRVAESRQTPRKKPKAKPKPKHRRARSRR